MAPTNASKEIAAQVTPMARAIPKPEETAEWRVLLRDSSRIMNGQNTRVNPTVNVTVIPRAAMIIRHMLADKALTKPAENSVPARPALKLLRFKQLQRYRATRSCFRARKRATADKPIAISISAKKRVHDGETAKI